MEIRALPICRTIRIQNRFHSNELERISETLDIEIKRLSAGKEGNLRALLSTLQYCKLGHILQEDTFSGRIRSFFDTVQLHERDQKIDVLERKMDETERELHAIRLNNEAAWAKEDLASKGTK